MQKVQKKHFVEKLKINLIKTRSKRVFFSKLVTFLNILLKFGT